ncbi:uncharacterized protein LOC142590713 [Dermacentor variabilis]|uniref:uncharacterized protein LOC142590713 n=1 Tax=Dermacentor variabilis TaxID=34621 RepID=UPI003F5B9715
MHMRPLPAHVGSFAWSCYASLDRVQSCRPCAASLSCGWRELSPRCASSVSISPFFMLAETTLKATWIHKKYATTSSFPEFLGKSSHAPTMWRARWQQQQLWEQLKR